MNEKELASYYGYKLPGHDQATAAAEMRDARRNGNSNKQPEDPKCDKDKVTMKYLGSNTEIAHRFECPICHVQRVRIGTRANYTIGSVKEPDQK